MEIIENERMIFVNPNDFENNLSKNQNVRKILLTIDDGYLSFYENAWPILKEKKIPFILFVNTREVGSFNYMNLSQILEIHNTNYAEIGNHSHSHEYLVDEVNDFIKEENERIEKEKMRHG